MNRQLFTVAFLLAAAFPLAAHAQISPLVHVTRNGNISSINGETIMLDNGATVYLNHPMPGRFPRTVISPEGTRLAAGQHVVVKGLLAANGAIDATLIYVRSVARR